MKSKIVLCIMVSVASPFMILGMLWNLARAGFQTGDEYMQRIGAKYL